MIGWVLLGLGVLYLASELSSDKPAGLVSGQLPQGGLLLEAGNRYNFTQHAPTIPSEDVAREAAASLASRGHQAIRTKRAKAGGFLFNYDSFVLPKSTTVSIGQRSNLGQFPTVLLAVKSEGSSPAEFANG